MNLMQRVRAYHVTLATLTILAFVTGDFGFIHDLLGYGVAAVIVLGDVKYWGLCRKVPKDRHLITETHGDFKSKRRSR